MIATPQGEMQVRRFNKRKYGKLLMESVPTVVRTEAEYNRAIEQIEKLLKKGDRISAEEQRLLDLLSALVEKYEDEHYPIEPLAPHEVLQHLMEARGLKPKDIVHLFGSGGRVSEATNGHYPLASYRQKRWPNCFMYQPICFLARDKGELSKHANRTNRFISARCALLARRNQIRAIRRKQRL